MLGTISILRLRCRGLFFMFATLEGRGTVGFFRQALFFPRRMKRLEDEVRCMSHLRSMLKSSGYDSEEAYFYAREQELIAELKKQRRAKSGLRLIQGGKKDEPLLQLPKGQLKKAA